GETFDVLRFLREKALRNEEREVAVLVTGLLEHPVQGGLHLLPDGVAIGADDHATANRAVVSKLGAHEHLVVPRGEILAPWSQSFGLSHAAPSAAHLPRCSPALLAGSRHPGA